MSRERVEQEEALNLDAIRTLPQYQLPTHYRLGTPGMGCAGDPPGYITYYMRPVYNQWGNHPDGAPDAVVLLDEVHYVVDGSADWKLGSWETIDAKRKARYRSLYKPLPIDHPRVQGWIQSTMSHHQRHYKHPTRPDEYGRGRLSFFWPFDGILRPKEMHHEREHEPFKDDPAWPEDLRQQWREIAELKNKAIDRENELIRQKNETVVKKWAQFATPSNHQGAMIIREIYPDLDDAYFVPYIVVPPRSGGNWWETSKVRPTPAECPGQFSRPHPANGSWCQWCGWREQ